jgi:LacI family transcriptional regulator
MKRRPTILDVAERAGVSKSTVSRVISNKGAGVREETEERVIKAMEELDYVHNLVASSLRTDRTQLVMLAIPDITNPIWAETARGVQDVMGDEGYDVVFANSDWNSQREIAFIQNAQRNRFDGILINPVQIREEDLVSSGIPIVLIGIREGYPSLDAVGSNTYDAVKEALAHLSNLGHKRIGVILGNRVRNSKPSRWFGYTDYHRETGIPLDENLTITVPFSQDGGKQGLYKLLSIKDPPTAILCDNDIVAIGVLLAAHETGIHVPNELSIFGIDDVFAASITTPPLTTIRKPKYELGRQAAKLLLERINHDDLGAPRKVILQCSLCIRGTTGKPNPM